MKKKLTLTLICLAYLVSSIAQPSPAAKFSERFQNIPGFENLRSFLPPKTNPQNKSGDRFELDTVYLFDTNELVGHHTFAYENGNCVNSIIKYSNPHWWASRKYTHTYNAQGNIHETVDQYFNWDTGEWVNDSKTIYGYNAQNILNECIVQHWNGGAWSDLWKISFTYDAQNNMTEQLIQVRGWEWENNVIFTYLYDEQNNMSEELIQIWESEQWEDDEAYIYLYDAQNNLIEKQQHEWNPYSEEWMYRYKWTFTYDTQNNRTEELYLRKSSDEWRNVSRISYTHDEHNNVSAGVYQKWGNNTWTDALGTLILHYHNMESAWYYDYLYKFSATYINVGSQSIQDHSIESAIKLYPNPVTNILHIETGSNVAPEIKVFSIQGVLLLQTKGNEIDLSSLRTGIYFAEIDGVCRKVVRQ